MNTQRTPTHHGFSARAALFARAALPGLGLCAALAALGLSPARARADERVVRHGLRAEEYQATFDELAKKGFRLHQVMPYVVDDDARFAAIWTKSDGTPWTARYGLPPADYQNLCNDFSRQGYRLAWVSGYELEGGVRYAAIWEKRTGAERSIRHGMTSAEYQSTYDYHVKQGYRPVHLSAYSNKGSARFAAIFSKDAGPLVSARHDLTDAELSVALSDHEREGYRLKTLNGYQAAGEVRYAALWEKAAKDDGAQQRARVALTMSIFPRLAARMRAAGFELAYVQAFPWGGGPMFNAIWERAAPAVAPSAAPAAKAPAKAGATAR